MRAYYPLMFVFVMYIWQTYEYWVLHRYGLALCFVGYAIALIGLMMDLKEVAV